MTPHRLTGFVAVSLALVVVPARAAAAAETAPAETKPAETAPPAPAPPRSAAPKAEEESRIRTSGWVTFFVGFAATGGGFALGSLALSLRDDLRREVADDEIEYRLYQRLVRRGSELAIAAYTLLAAGTAVSAAGIYLLVRKPKDRPGFIIAFTPVEGGGMALASGDF